MLESLKFVQWAVARKNFAPELTHFQIKDGFIRSFNGSISLCCPIELKLNCMPKAAAFMKAIQTCRETVKLSLTPTGKLSVVSGKFRALIECLPEGFPEMAPEGRELAVEADFLDALSILEPLIGEDASRPWSRGILFKDGWAYATNNIVAARFDAGQTALSGINLPHGAVNEILRIGKRPVRALVSENSISFVYDDGSWLRTALLPADLWPDIDKLVDGANELDLDYIPDEFFQGLDDLAPFTDELRSVFIKPNYLTTSLNPEAATYINVPGLLNFGKFNIDMWRLLKGVAQTMGRGERESLVFFAAPNLMGAIIGMREL